MKSPKSKKGKPATDGLDQYNLNDELKARVRALAKTTGKAPKDVVIDCLVMHIQKTAPPVAPAPVKTPITFMAEPETVAALTRWHGNGWFVWDGGGVHLDWMAGRILEIALAHPKELFHWYSGDLNYCESEDIDQGKFFQGQIAARPEYKRKKCPFQTGGK